MTPTPRAALPVRPRLQPEQSLDSYLEHVAVANHLTATDLTSRIDATTRFLLLKPADDALHAIARLTGQPVDQLRRATLARYDGTALDLTALDPDRPASYRALAARGWAPGAHTTICPACLADHSRWHIGWRLPLVTVCTTHRVYLHATCPGCNRPFRAPRHTHLRPIGTATCCGNPLGQRGRSCRTDLTTLATTPADTPCIRRQQLDDTTLEGHPRLVLGIPTPPHAALAALRSITVLLLHIATTAPHTARLPHWVETLRTDVADNQSHRWGIAPPQDIPTRSRALSTAAHLLDSPDLETAATRLEPWLAAIPSTANGILGWVADHSTPSPATTRIVTAAHAPRRRLSWALDHLAPLTSSPRHIPQVIDADLVSRHLDGLFTSRPTTVRAFTALCIARTHPHVCTWADAAAALGLPAQHGIGTARAASTGMTGSPSRVVDAITRLAAHLPALDHRQAEHTVRAFAHDPSWFAEWGNHHRPGTRPTSITYALAWLWTETAHGHLDAAPGWTTPPSRDERARARRFAASLTNSQQTHLRAVVARGREPSP